MPAGRDRYVLPAHSEGYRRARKLRELESIIMGGKPAVLCPGVNTVFIYTGP